MPIKHRGSVNMPENAREHRTAKKDETRLTANEGRGEKGLDSTRKAGR